MTKCKNRLLSQVSAVAMVLALASPQTVFAQKPESLCDLAAKSIAKKLEALEKEENGEKDNEDGFAPLIAGNPSQEAVTLVIQQLKPGATFFNLFKGNEEKLKPLSLKTVLAPEEETQKRIRIFIRDGFFEVLRDDYFNVTRNEDKSLSIGHPFFEEPCISISSESFQSFFGETYFKLSVVNPLAWDHDAIALIRQVHFKSLKIQNLDRNTQKLSAFLEATGGQLEELELPYNQLNNTAAEVIAKNGKLTNLTFLNLERNHIAAKGAKALATGNLTGLTSLNLENNDLESDAAKALAAGNFTGLTSLNLGYSYPEAKGVAAIAVSNFTSLTSLNLDSSYIENEGAKVLAAGNFTGLISLNLKHNGIRAKGAKALAAGNFTGLISLNLEWNCIGDVGAVELAAGNLTGLISLNLKHNGIGAKGAKALAAGNLAGLTSLNLKHNGIGDNGAAAIVAGNLTDLTYLNIKSNYIGTKMKEMLCALKIKDLKI